MPAGCLDETLVVTMGEMGRTPKINANGGRDHWTYCYSVLLAGAGIRGGTIYGASDEQAAFIKDKPVHIRDICATIYHLLGIDPEMPVYDRADRPIASRPRRTCRFKGFWHNVRRKDRYRAISNQQSLQTMFGSAATSVPSLDVHISSFPQLIGQFLGAVDLAQRLDDCRRVDARRAGLVLTVDEVEHQRLDVAVEDQARRLRPRG